MRVLVTGASGRIGAQLTRALQTKGYRVRGLDLVDASHVDEAIIGSLLDEDTLERALVDVDSVIHLAALMSWHPDDDASLFDMNVRGTFALLQAATARPLTRFVFASSGEVYPELAPRYLPLDEAHPTEPTSTYGLTKLLGEEAVRHYGRRKGASYCILRFAHTQASEELLDPGSFFSGPRFYVNAKLRQLKGSPSTPEVEKSIAALEAVATPSEQHYIGCNADGQSYRMGICDVRDMVQGVLLGLEHPAAANETFNIGPKESVDFDFAVPYLARVTGLSVVQISLSTAPYRYHTSVLKASRLLGYRPRYDFFHMVDEAALDKARSLR